MSAADLAAARKMLSGYRDQHAKGLAVAMFVNVDRKLARAEQRIAELTELANMVTKSDHANRWGDACRPIVERAHACLRQEGAQ